MPTLEETKVLARGSDFYDPIYVDEARVHEMCGALFVEGSSGDDHSEDLLIVPCEASWLLFWRSPEGGEGLWDRSTWHGGETHFRWDSLLTSVYEL